MGHLIRPSYPIGGGDGGLVVLGLCGKGHEVVYGVEEARLHLRDGLARREVGAVLGDIGE